MTGRLHPPTSIRNRLVAIFAVSASILLVLTCALLYIEITSDVVRYRDKIQKMGSPQAMK